MIDARNRQECEEWGGEWVTPHIRQNPTDKLMGPSIYVSAYCRKPRKGSRDYKERIEEFEGYDIPGARRPRELYIDDGEVRDPKTGQPIYDDFWKNRRK